MLRPTLGGGRGVKNVWALKRVNTVIDSSSLYNQGKTVPVLKCASRYPFVPSRFATSFLLMCEESIVFAVEGKLRKLWFSDR